MISNILETDNSVINYLLNLGKYLIWASKLHESPIRYNT